MPQVFYKWTEWTDDNRWEEKVMQYTRGICVQIRQYLSLVSDTEVEKYWKKPNELIFKAHIKKVLFLKTFSCLVVLATSSVRIGLLIGKTAKKAYQDWSSQLTFSLQNYVLRTDRWRHVYWAVAGEGVRALWKETREAAAAENDEARLKQTHLTHMQSCVHIRTYGFPVMYSSCFNLYFFKRN